MFSKRTLWAVFFLLGVATVGPSALSGFLLDDMMYLSMMEDGHNNPQASNSFFAFFSGDEKVTNAVAARGDAPWWVWDGLKLAFFRPLSALLLRLDYVLFGDSALFYHLHTMLWWVCYLIVVGCLLRHILPMPLAVIAFALFALDESHSIPASWISNRNALVAMVFATLGLLCHLRLRESSWRPGRWLSPVLLLLSLLAGETGLVGFGYLFAYELVRPEAVRTKLSFLLPSGLLLACYVFVYKFFGYGAFGSGVYLDPSAQPWAYLAWACVRIPILLAGAFVGVPAELSIVQPTLITMQVIVGVIVFVLTIVLYRSFWTRLNHRTKSTVSWLSIGSFLSMIPVVATFPSDRLLLGPAMGICSLIAILVGQGWQVWNRIPSWPGFVSNEFSKTSLAYTITFKVIVVFLVVVHLIWTPLYHTVMQISLFGQVHNARSVARSFDFSPEKDFILLNAPDHVVAIYLPFIRSQLDLSLPRSYRVLSLSHHPIEVTRKSENQLELKLLEGELIENLFEVLYRDQAHALKEGEILHRGILQAKIVEMGRHGPTRVRFTFDRALEDPRYQWALWQDRKLFKIPPPKIDTPIKLVRSLGPAGF